MAQHKWRKRIRLAGVLALIAVSVSVGMRYAYDWVQTQRSEPTYSSVIFSAMALDKNANYQAESNVLSAYLKTKPPKQYLYPIHLQLALVEYRLRHYSSAENQYLSAQSSTKVPQLAVAQGLAKVYSAEGKNQAAIAQYKEAISLLNTQSVAGSDFMIIQEYNSQIHALTTKS
ncbi:MAG TPA: hypothetical protein VMS08_04765 [Candidatus Saccharimonadia bacterium]|nr:hypothetical protein [Candidatus Saccharimonadia bacterium]